MIKGQDFTGITVIFLCHDGQGNYLLNKRGPDARDEHGVWDPGGGSIQFGENVEDALKREVKEEYGVLPLEYEFLGYRDIHRTFNKQATHWLGLAFKVLVDRKKVKNNEPHKFVELGWFKLDNLPEPLHSQFPETIHLFSDRLK